MPDNAVQFYIAEVIGYNDTFKDPDPGSAPDDTINSITVLIKEEDRPVTIPNVCPFNSNVKQIPVIGENVLICQGYSSFSTYDNRLPKWYYFQPMSVQSNVNNNIIRNNTTNKPIQTETVFTEKPVNALQPYSGDVLVEGRWGNTIRLGSTGKSDPVYSNSPLWKGKTVTSPIIILSNNVSSNNSNAFHVENIETDYSGLYLTSDQQLNTLKLGNKNKRNPISNYKGESTFNKSQLVGVADRIVLKSKTDIVVLDSPKAIILNTTGLVKIGSDKANVPMVHGDVLETILLNIIHQLTLTPIQCGSAVGTFTTTKFADKAKQQIDRLLSKKYYITKTN